MVARPAVWITDHTVCLASGDGLPDSAMAEPWPTSTQTLPVAELAAAADRVLSNHQSRSGPLTLVVPGTWCYVHRFALPQRRPNETMLAYAFEEFLPVECEQLTCDFLRTETGDFLGVGVETARLRPLLDAFAEAGWTVAHITVDAWQAFGTTAAAGVRLWCDQGHVTAVITGAQGLQDVRVVRLADGLTDAEWARRVGQHLDLSRESSPALAGCVSPVRLALLATALGATPAAAAQRGSRRPLPEVDLARRALASTTQRAGPCRAWRGVALTTLLALLVLGAGLWVHRTRAEGQLRAVAAWEARVFAGLFPNEPVPAGVALRLASERRRLEGLTLAATPAVRPAEDALDTLRTLVAALPPDVRLDVQELRIEAGNVTLRGRCRDHRQAEQITASLDALEGLACPAARTQRLQTGEVQFFISAQPVAVPDTRRGSTP